MTRWTSSRQCSENQVVQISLDLKKTNKKTALCWSLPTYNCRSWKTEVTVFGSLSLFFIYLFFLNICLFLECTSGKCFCPSCIAWARSALRKSRARTRGPASGDAVRQLRLPHSINQIYLTPSICDVSIYSSISVWIHNIYSVYILQKKKKTPLRMNGLCFALSKMLTGASVQDFADPVQNPPHFTIRTRS